MKSLYKSIFGFMDFEDLYKYMVDIQEGRGAFLEVGCFMGKSIMFLSEYIDSKNKDIKVYCVDNFEGCCYFKENKIFNKKNLKNSFLRNTRKAPIKIKLFDGDSVQVSTQLEKEYLDFVFLDGCHEYSCIKKDILAFRPLVKKGGYIGGHDFNDLYPGVKKAVHEIFGNRYNIDKQFNNCWLQQI